MNGYDARGDMDACRYNICRDEIAANHENELGYNAKKVTQTKFRN
jgi:hypothetical protein